MTYRELLNLYKQGKLDDVRKKEVEAAIEKQDAISEFLYEEGEIPEFLIWRVRMQRIRKIKNG